MTLNSEYNYKEGPQKVWVWVWVFVHEQTLLQERVKRKIYSPKIYLQDSWVNYFFWEISPNLSPAYWQAVSSSGKHLEAIAFSCLPVIQVYIGVCTPQEEEFLLKVMQMYEQGKAKNAQKVWEVPKKNQFSKSI